MISCQHIAMKCFVTQIDISLHPKLRADLEDQDFEFTSPPYTLFLAKKKGLSCTLFESGKLVIQGKDMDAFIEFYLEPQILHSFEYSNPQINADLTPRIGIDEAGKGDFFGPLCIAGLFASADEIPKLIEMGVKDSKTLSDKTILKLAKSIKASFQHQIVAIFPKRYNELYQGFKNLNSLLAWGHATTIEALITKTGCTNVIVDQFANEYVVLSALKKKNIHIPLIQKHRAEEDVVVAGASILARAAFVEGLEALSKNIGVQLPKGGASQTINVGKSLLLSHGQEIFSQIAKLHFKNYNEIVGEK